MKKLAIAATLLATASAVNAGSYEAPMMEQEIIVEETAASSGADEWVLVMMAFLIIVTMVGSQ